MKYYSLPYICIQNSSSPPYPRPKRYINDKEELDSNHHISGSRTRKTIIESRPRRDANLEWLNRTSLWLILLKMHCNLQRRRTGVCSGNVYRDPEGPMLELRVICADLRLSWSVVRCYQYDARAITVFCLELSDTLADNEPLRAGIS